VTPPDEFDHVLIPVNWWDLEPCGDGGEIDVMPIVADAATAASLSDVTATTHRIFTGLNGGECSWRDRTTCPITAQLAARIAELQQVPTTGPGPVAPFCRCPNAFEPVIDPEMTGDSGIAHVTLGTIRVDLRMVRQDGRLLVDDTWCTGRSGTTSMMYGQFASCA
jgi:hypothetical protein